jgi:hypothetical protein
LPYGIRHVLRETRYHQQAGGTLQSAAPSQAIQKRKISPAINMQQNKHVPRL